MKISNSMCAALASAFIAAFVHIPAPARAGLGDSPGPLWDSSVRQKGAIVGFELPPVLCSLVEGAYAADRPAAYPGQPVMELPGLDGQGAPMGTGMGFDIGPLRIGGIGVYGPGDNLASLGPSFRFNIDKGFEITTGMQLPVTENGPAGSPDLYYAELTILF